MTDNTRGGSQDAGNPLIATDEVTYSGDTADVQLMRLVNVVGSEGSKTVEAITTGTQYVEDTAIPANAGQGTLVVARRDDALSTLTPAENDAVGIRVDSAGALWTRVTSIDTISSAVDVTGSDVNVVSVDGGIPHDSADAGGPVKIGGKATDQYTITAVALNDRVNAAFDTAGRQGVFIGQDGNSGDTVSNASVLAAVGMEEVYGPLETAGFVFNGTTWDRVRGQGGAVNVAPVDPSIVAADAASNTVTAYSTDVLGGASVPVVANLLFNGTTWDRQRGTTNGTQVIGAAAHASPTAGNPVYVAGRASTAVPTDVGADGDAAGLWTNRNGAPVQTQAPHVGLNSDPWNLVHEGVRYTSAQTSTVVVAGGASEKIVVTKVQLATEGTTAGTAILYFGTGAFARGTNRACFDGNFIPSATSAPGVVMDGPFIAGANGDDLMFTSVGAITIVVNVWYYVVT